MVPCWPGSAWMIYHVVYAWRRDTEPDSIDDHIHSDKESFFYSEDSKKDMSTSRGLIAIVGLKGEEAYE